MATTLCLASSARSELDWCGRQARAPTIRTLRQFAQAEMVIPEGQYRNLKLRIRRQPYVGLLFDAVDSGRWPRTAILGPVQSGKTLCGFVTPVMYHLFEHGETVICGIPTMDVAADKWREEILPAIEASRYRHLLPRRGPGSRGGTGNLTAVRFRNGATLKFMSGHGGDEKRSSFTARVVVITEADKMDEAGASSREADPVSQLEARTLSYDEPERRIYLECTVSIELGRIWTEYTNGTAGRIVVPCPLCGDWVTPEREHLQGWQSAETVFEARRAGHFCCPSCGKPWTDQQRVDNNLAARLVHRGQEITPDGRIVGEPAETDTLGFRWNAYNNLFWSVGAIAAHEWKAAHAEDEDEAEKELLQFWWAKPYKPPQLDLTPLDVQVIRKRTGGERRGLVPADTEHLTMALDLGKWVGWWVLIAWRPGGGGHIVDYSTIEIPSKDHDVEQAVLLSLRDFRDNTVMQGWPMRDGDDRVPDQVWIDAGYVPEPVKAFCRESGRRWLPAVGLGIGQHYRRRYTQPKQTGKSVRKVGLDYHVLWSPSDRCFVAEVNADYWKSHLHDRLSTPVDQPGALTLYTGTDPNEHLSLAKHFTAEKQIEDFIPGVGTVVRWVRESRKNHYLDCGYLASAAGHLCGVRLVGSARKPAAPRAGIRSRTMPDGRPYLITER